MGAGQNIEYMASRKVARDAADIRGLLPTVTHEVMHRRGHVRPTCMSCGGSKSRSATICRVCFGRLKRWRQNGVGIESLPVGSKSAPPRGNPDLRVGRVGHVGVHRQPPAWKRRRLVDGVWVDA